METRHHYRFVHWGLRRSAATEPQFMLDCLCSESASDYLGSIYNWIEIECAEDGPAPFGVDQIRVQEVSSKLGVPAVMIVMPPPLNGSEAYSACLVKIPTQFRLFTLEMVQTKQDEEPRTFVCEWEKESHVNYGKINEVSDTAFIKEIKRLISPAP